MQRKDLIAYSEMILGIDDYVVFEDAGYSGKDMDRPACQEMIARIRSGEFSHLLVWKIDRISRNLLDFAAMYDELQNLGVTFISRNEQFDTSTAMGGAMLKIILVFAELERKMTSERVFATMLSRAEKGYWNGGPPPYGYSYDRESRTFSIVEEEAAAYRAAYELYMKKRSVKLVAACLNQIGYRKRSGGAWNPDDVLSILKNPFCTGVYRWNRLARNSGSRVRRVRDQSEWVVVKNHHPAILTEEEYADITRVLSSNRTGAESDVHASRGKYVYVFSGLCFCENCGSKMTPHIGRVLKDGYLQIKYRCSAGVPDGICRNGNIRESVLGDFVFNYIHNILLAQKRADFVDERHLELFLLKGLVFSEVAHIDSEGLGRLYNLILGVKGEALGHYEVEGEGSGGNVEDEEGRRLAAAESEISRDRRALDRLQNLYLYSDAAMSEREYISRKTEIEARIRANTNTVAELRGGESSLLTDAEFIELGSRLALTDWMAKDLPIIYRSLATSVSLEVLRDFVNQIVSRVYVSGRRVIRIVFRNGLENRFIWE